MKTIQTLLIAAAALLPHAGCADETHYPTWMMDCTGPAEAMTDAQRTALGELSKVSIRVENARIETKGTAPMLRCELVVRHQGNRELVLCCHGRHIRTACSGQFTLDGRAYDYTPDSGKMTLTPGKPLRIPVAIPVKQKTFRSIRYTFPVVSLGTGGTDYDMDEPEKIESQQ